MNEEHINDEFFRIPRKDLEERIRFKLNGRYGDYPEIIPLRHLKQIDHLAFITQELLEKIVRGIPLRGNQTVHPYSDSEITLYSREPKGMLLSQRFVMEGKLLELMQSFSTQELFKKYITKGISYMPPVKVYGRDSKGNKAISIYLPPIIEQREEGDVLLDGTHRSYICKSVGSSIYAVHIRGVETKYPTTPVTWDECQTHKIKPPKNIRYKNLDETVFRDLNYVGIDG